MAADKFAPELQTNRAMLVTILWRMEGSPMSETSFAPSRKTGRFKVLATAGMHLFILLFQQVEILIST